LKFHCSSSSGEREITVFKTLDSPTQISVVLRGPAGQGFPIMKILKQPRITASLILKIFKGTLILKLEPEVLWLAPPLPSLPKSFRNQTQRLYWKKFKSDNYSTTRIFTIYLNRDLKKTDSGVREEAECAHPVPILVASLLQSGVHAVSARCCALHSWQCSWTNKTIWWVE
jgi:hypothetical protein